MFRNIIWLIGKIVNFFRLVKYVDKDNLPSGGFILAGNHTSNMNAFDIYCCTRRKIHILAKKELFDTKFKKWFFTNLYCIPVDRSRKTPEVIDECVKLLKNDEIVCLFPEGTINRTEYVVRDFKMGTVKIAKESNKPIVPFAITKKGLRTIVTFGKPYKITDKLDLKKENITLMNKVIKLMKNGNSK